MASITLKSIRKVYGNQVEAVHDFNMEIADKEFIILVGPSGCGKSTTLRMIAGLEEITGGELYIEDQLVNQVAPKDRDIAMVFQSYALYPHMSVEENMSIGLELRKVDKGEIKRRVAEAAKILGIEDLLRRKPRQLSGGQQQRVALGRAMVREPKVFLLDEPLSNLDAKLRQQMRLEIINLHKRLQTTFVYVTHDQIEAMTMGDRIVVMDQGYVQQIDTPENLYEHPCNLFVAGFIGTPPMNLLECQLCGQGPDAYVQRGAERFAFDAGRAVPGTMERLAGKQVLMGIRPEALSPLPPGEPAERNVISARIELSEMVGSETYVHVTTGGEPLVMKVSSHNRLPDGEQVSLYVAPERIYLFDPESGQAFVK